MNDYMQQIGLFAHAREVLAKRQAQRQEAEQAKEAKKRGKTVDWGKVSGR
jgi:hypothetical protein